MEAPEPSQFYTGIVAEMYAQLRGSDPDPDVCERFIRANGEPALELGCGDGDPILELRRRGLVVEGVDSSADMLARARAAANAAGLHVVLHHQTMEQLSLPGRYRSIFLAGPTFNLLPDDAAALDALRSIAAHLHPDGRALVPLHVPELAPSGSSVGRERVRELPDGRVMRFVVAAVERDDEARTQTALLRYTLEAEGTVEVVERPWVLHWFPAERFTELVEAAGLTVESVTGLDGSLADRDGPYANWTLSPGRSGVTNPP